MDKNILIVDQEPKTSKRIKGLLNSHGYSAHITDKTDIPAETISNDRVDLLLLNLMLPDSRNAQICQDIKAHPSTRDIPVMMLSDSRYSSVASSLEVMADDHLLKPYASHDLIRHVDTLLYRSELLKKDRLSIPTHIQEELKQIVAQESMIPHFQPIYFLKPHKLLGIEVLSRPQVSGLLSNPQILFQTALKYGVYFDIEMIVWRQALNVFKQYFDNEFLFLNCDPFLLEHENFNKVKDIFNYYGVKTSQVFLEITERSAISNEEDFFKRLKQYRKDGFKIAVDDVGSGYSSLESIVEIQPEIVKLDRRIVQGLKDNTYKKSMIRLIVSFCKENNMLCIAEGIEDKNDYELLVGLGVDAGQGYFFSAPKRDFNLELFRNASIL